LDTHAWIWWLSDPENLSRRARAEIEREMKQEGQVLVSSISVWELAQLVSVGRLTLSMSARDWVAQAEQVAAIRYVPLNNEIALESVNLPGTFHRDPADRMIVATARVLTASVVSRDRKIASYKYVETIW
jgi:PIN domain nuclease of toxin-antitoxin system